MAEMQKNGWYRYDSRFALPVYDDKCELERYDTSFAMPVYSDDGELERYNVFKARLLIRHASSGKKYLYDVLEIKKETSKSCQA